MIRIRAPRWLAMLMPLLVLAACGGPRSPLEIGVKEFATEVLLGRQPDAGPPPPSLGPDVGFPGFIQAPPPRIPVPSPGPQPECPAAHPFDAPRLPATNRSLKPPVAAEYRFLTNGTFDIQGPEPRSGRYPQLTTRRITNVATQQNEFTFDIVEDQLDEVTTTSYRVVPQSAFEPTISNPPDAGIFITQRVRQVKGQDPESFRPTPALQLLPFPVVQGTEWDTRAIDPVTQTTMQFHGAVVGKSRVDACGKVLDAWTVSVTDGFISGPTKSLSFSAAYAIATQFGGFSVSDRVQMFGTDGDHTINTLNQSVIMSEPAEPTGGATTR